MLSLFLILSPSILNVSENYLASNSLDKNLCNLFIFFFFNMKCLFSIYKYCFVRLCEEEIWGFFLLKVLKNDSQRDIKKRIADSNIGFSSFFNSNAWWLQVALVFQKLCFSCSLSCILNAFQISKFVCIAVVAHFFDGSKSDSPAATWYQCHGAVTVGLSQDIHIIQ